MGKKKKIILICMVVFVVIGSFMTVFIVHSLNKTKFNKKEEVQQEEQKDSNKKTKGTQKEEAKNKEKTLEQETTTEETNENIKEATTQKGNNNHNSNIRQDSDTPNKSSNNNTQTPSSQPTQPPQTPSKPQTEWEKLGISEYEYYNAKLYDEEEVAFKNIVDCKNEAIRINNTYDFVTNSGNVSGKYVNSVGCWVEVYIDGKPYSLSEFKAMGYK